MKAFSNYSFLPPPHTPEKKNKRKQNLLHSSPKEFSRWVHFRSIFINVEKLKTHKNTKCKPKSLELKNVFPKSVLNILCIELKPVRH